MGKSWGKIAVIKNIVFNSVSFVERCSSEAILYDGKGGGGQEGLQRSLIRGQVKAYKGGLDYIKMFLIFTNIT